MRHCTVTVTSDWALRVSTESRSRLPGLGGVEERGPSLCCTEVTGTEITGALSPLGKPARSRRPTATHCQAASGGARGMPVQKPERHC
eukprot:2081992-Rhodomonas_salina.1